VGTGYDQAAGSRFPRPPLTLVVALVSALVFGLALLIGWVTAGTRENLRHVERRNQVAVPQLVLLGSAARLPAPPPPRKRARTSHAPPVPKVIVGSG
jgi:hypothetical protein